MRRSLFQYAPGRAALSLQQQSICPRFASTMAFSAVASTSKDTTIKDRQLKTTQTMTSSGATIQESLEKKTSPVPKHCVYSPKDLLQFDMDIPRDALLFLWPICLKTRQLDLICSLIRRLRSKRVKILPPSALQHLHQSLDLIRLKADPLVRITAVLLIARTASSQIQYHQEPALGLLRRCLSILRHEPKPHPAGAKDQLQVFFWQLSKRPELTHTSLLPGSKRDRARDSRHSKLNVNNIPLPPAPDSLTAQRQFNLRLARALQSRRGYHRSMKLLSQLALKLLQNADGFQAGNSVAANMVAKVALRNPAWSSVHVWQFMREGLKTRTARTAQESHDLLVFLQLVADAFGARSDGAARKQVIGLIEQVKEALH